MQASSRAEIEQSVCNRLTAVDSYVGAWFADSRAVDQRLVPRAWAGLTEADLDVILTVSHDSDSTGWPSLRARDTHEIQVARNLLEESIPETGVDSLTTGGLDVTIAIPILHEETVYGVLQVYAEDSITIGERQQAVLAELGETIGHAIAAAERKEALVADSVLELTLGIRDQDQFFVRVARQLEASVRLEGVARRDDAPYLEFFTVTGTTPAAILDAGEQLESVDHARVIHHQDEECLCEIGETDPSILTRVAEFGGTLTEMTAENGTGSVRIEVPRSTETNHVIDALRSTVEDVDLRSKRTVDRPIRTEYRFQSTVDDRLTDKQREALDAAYLAGFFEQPRLSTGEEIADSLEISPSTFHQHIRVGLQKILATVVERPQERTQGD